MTHHPPRAVATAPAKKRPRAAALSTADQPFILRMSGGTPPEEAESPAWAEDNWGRSPWPGLSIPGDPGFQPTADL